MTQSIIEKLKSLTVYYDDQMQCLTVKEDDLRAIIEDAKTEKQEPVAIVDKSIQTCEIQYTYSVGDDGLPDGTLLYTTPQPDIVAELVKALEVCVSAYMVPSSNHAAATKKLIAKAKEMMG